MNCTICGNSIAAKDMVGSLHPLQPGPFHSSCYEVAKAVEDNIKAVEMAVLCDRWRCGNFKLKPCDCKPKE